MTNQQRDHLFISYAWEDAALAEWLALKLTAEGYKVWCDRFKLLGGESYPQDIDRAIKEQTFRVLGLLSKHSLNKANPLKERTLALNLGRERGEDFLIPINVDGLKPTELSWMVSDLTYVPFQHSWAQGLAQLLKKLQALDAPRALADGRQAVVDWFAARDSVNDAAERLWTSLLEITELPRTLVRISLDQPMPPDVARTWPHYRENPNRVWAFEAPEDCVALEIADVEEVAWEQTRQDTRLKLPDVVTSLLKQHLRAHCLRKGIQETPNGQHLYFPPGLLTADRLAFEGFGGSRTWVLAVGERTFKLGATERETSRYHLSPTFRPYLWKFEVPVVQVQMRVYLTNTEGKPLPARKAARRRKRICRNWWNYEWLARTLGVAGWMADGAESFDLARAPGCHIILGGRPIQLEAPVGIDESTLATAAPQDSEEAELSDEDDDARDANADAPDEEDPGG